MRHRDLIIIKKVISEINIGELIKNITDETRLKYADIPWKTIAGMRDVTAHKYQTLRMEDVYNTVRENFPQLKKDLTEIVAEKL